jgi:hypothetical protein
VIPYRFFLLIKVIFADAGYQGQNTATAIAKTGTWKLTIVQRNDNVELSRIVHCVGSSIQQSAIWKR